MPNPAIFLLKGKKAPVGPDQTYLTKYGGAPGSDVHMTQNAHMSKEAWEGGGVGSSDGDDVGIARKIAAGIRKMPVIIDHPDWWVRFTEDGVYVHKFSLAAQKVFHEHKIANVIEEGFSSHINQPFDREVAKKGKHEMKSAIAVLQKSNAVGSVMSQQHLVFCALHGLRLLGGTTSPSPA